MGLGREGGRVVSRVTAPKKRVYLDIQSEVGHYQKKKNGQVPKNELGGESQLGRKT